MIAFANRFRLFLFLVAYAFGTLGMLRTAAGKDASTQAPIPEMAAQQKSAKDVKEVYGSEIAAAKTPAAKSDVAKKMLQAGIDEKNDLAGSYALFTLAKDTAADALDLILAWQVVDEMQKVFQFDGPKMKADLATGVAKTLKTPSERTVFAEQVNVLIQELLRQTRFDLAKQAGDLALVAARSANDPQLVRQATARVQQIRDTESAYGEIKQAMVTLEKSPSDPDANLKLGRFRCLVQGDWQNGLPMLALGSDQTLKALAGNEISGATTPEEKMKLADGWWAVAEKEKGTAKDQAQAKSVKWYEQAVPALSGLAKAKAEKRMKDAAGSVVSATKDGDNAIKNQSKAVLASKGKTFDLSNEAHIKEFWALPESNDMWQNVNGGIHMTGKHLFLDSTFTVTGDCTVQITLVNKSQFEATEITLYGEKINCPRSGWDKTKEYAITVQRKGDKLLCTVNGEPSTIVLKDNALTSSSHLEIRQGQGEMTVKSIRITAGDVRRDGNN